MKVLARLTFLLVVQINIYGQSQVSTGEISGVVADTSGAVLPGASITVINQQTGFNRAVMTDHLGNFQFLLVPPAVYDLKVELPGFATYFHKSIHLTVGQTVFLSPQLPPAPLSVELEVKADVSLIETKKTHQSDTITIETINNLPINARNFLDFTLLTPGVTDSRALVTFTLPQTPTSGLSFTGQSGRSNSVTIDGADNNDNSVSAVRSTMSQDAVQEFQINRLNYSAEFGRASGGVINIVSRSGTNRNTGSAFAFLRNQALDARNAFAFGPHGSDINPPFSRLQSGFTLGGPVRHDRTFYFLSYEGLRQRESNFVTFLENEEFLKPTASQQALIAALQGAPVQTLANLGRTLQGVLTTSDETFPGTMNLLRQSSGVFPFRSDTNTSSLRIDHSLAPTNQLQARLTFTNTDTIGGAYGGLKGPSRGANFHVRDYGAVLGDTHFLGSRAANEFRFQFANRDFNVLPVDAIGPEININGVALLGRDFFLPSTRNEKRYQWLDNFTVISGRHETKFGTDLEYIPLDTVTEVFLGGRFIFGEAVPLAAVIDNLAGQGTATAVADALAQIGRTELIPNVSAPVSSLQAFNFGLPLLYQQGFGNPRAKLSNKILSGYVQDHLNLSKSLTLNYGVRYELELQPSPIHRDKNNFAPRFGFSYSPDSKSVVRGGYGIYYAPVFGAVSYVGRVLDGSQISQLFVPLTGLPQLGISATSSEIWTSLRKQNILGNRAISTTDIARFGLRPGTTPPVLWGAAPDLENPYSQQAAFGIQRELRNDLTFSVDYLFNHGLKILRSRNTNLAVTGINQFGPVFGSINQFVLQTNQIESSAMSKYHGASLGVTKRFSQNYQFQLSYTFSKVIDDSTDFIGDLQAANQLNLRGERSLSSFDQRHRVVVSGYFETPVTYGRGLRSLLAHTIVAPILTVSSGHPFNLLMGSDANGDTNANTDRPLYAGRNTGQGPGLIDIDLRVAKSFPLAHESPLKIEAIVEAFNLFNHVNFSGVNNIVGLTTFPSYRVKGNPSLPPTAPLGFTSAFDPRQIQLALKVQF